MDKLPSLDHYRIIREKWTHEDHLINHRISWLLVSQALFFASYGVFSNITSNPLWTAKAAKVMIVIPILGIIITVLAGAAIFAALVSQRSLSKFSFELSASDTKIIGVNTCGQMDMLGHLPAALLPIIFVIAWIALLIA